ncbi:MAG: right-handed parallel beta-helix repeat-containing protein [Candidatus Thorarchaeota archaeon]
MPKSIAYFPYEEPIIRTPHATITIDGDANFSNRALLEGWPGDGSPEHPFVIDGFEINKGGETGPCVWIRNTRVSFTISNCNITGASSASGWLNFTFSHWGGGIILENVTNGELVNNTCNSNNEWGILLFNSKSITVSNNICNNNKYGIILYAYYEYNVFNTVINNRCFNNTEFGIFLSVGFSGFQCNNTIFNNTCTLNGKSGIHLNYLSYYNTVANNTCNSNGINGISLESSYLNTIANNTCNSNGSNGIALENSDSNIVANNTCNSNEFRGIDLYRSDSNTVFDNICNSNTGGIYLGRSSSNIIMNNICNNNEFHGILTYDSDSNTITNNICLNNAATTETPIPTTTTTPTPTTPTTTATISPMTTSPILPYIGFIDIILLGVAWKLLSERRGFNESSTRSMIQLGKRLREMMNTELEERV